MSGEFKSLRWAKILSKKLGQLSCDGNRRWCKQFSLNVLLLTKGVVDNEGFKEHMPSSQIEWTVKNDASQGFCRSHWAGAHCVTLSAVVKFGLKNLGWQPDKGECSVELRFFQKLKIAWLAIRKKRDEKENWRTLPQKQDLEIPYKSSNFLYNVTA